MVRHAVLADAAEFAGEFGGEDQTDRDRLAMGDVVIGGRLECVGQRVAVVEQCPAAAFAFVRRDDVGLDLDTARRCDRSSGIDDRSSPVRKWYFDISPSPHRVSRSGSVASASRSQMTPEGCQNAPTRFLPSGRLTPVLPPIAASTMPSNVVETCTTGVPRCHTDAAKPATSVTMPPPTPTTTSWLVRPWRANPRQSVSTVASDFAASPLPISTYLDLAALQRSTSIGTPPG
jgi:hypothetical protein